jgi:hypothetical protein
VLTRKENEQKKEEGILFLLLSSGTALRLCLHRGL